MPIRRKSGIDHLAIQKPATALHRKNARQRLRMLELWLAIAIGILSFCDEISANTYISVASSSNDAQIVDSSTEPVSVDPLAERESC